MSMGIPFSANRTFSLDFSRVSNSGSPGRVYNALRQYEEFQVLFGDRLQKHCFNGGALTTESLQERWDTLVDLVRSPVVAESARWGKDVWSGSNRVNPFTRNVQWNAAENYVRNTFIPNRTNAILTHFRNVGLFPEEPAPVATPRSTLSPTPFDVTLTTDSLGSVIYYTIDGTDPRVLGLSSGSVSEDSQVRYYPHARWTRKSERPGRTSILPPISALGLSGQTALVSKSPRDTKTSLARISPTCTP